MNIFILILFLSVSSSTFTDIAARTRNRVLKHMRLISTLWKSHILCESRNRIRISLLSHFHISRCITNPVTYILIYILIYAVTYMLQPTSCCSFILSPSNAFLASSRASPRRAFLSLSAAPSLSACTSPCSLCTSVSRILIDRASSISCCRTRVSRPAAISRSFSSWSLARRSVSATACLCCSSSRACRCSWTRSRSLHTWVRETQQGRKLLSS